jgi:hypothetical protein
MSPLCQLQRLNKHAQIRDIFESLISLDRVKTNQNGGFLYFGDKIAFKNLLIFEKKLEHLFGYRCKCLGSWVQ